MEGVFGHTSRNGDAQLGSPCLLRMILYTLRDGYGFFGLGQDSQRMARQRMIVVLPVVE